MYEDPANDPLPAPVGSDVPSDGSNARNEDDLALCPICESRFKAKYRQKFCSKDCANEEHSRRFSGPNNPNYKDGKTVYRQRKFTYDYMKEKRKDPAFRETERWAYIKRRYGITKEQWLDLFDKQGKSCACCGATEPGSKIGWHTDHNHLTNKVRGILCHACNIILGCIRDSAEKAEILAHKLAGYIRTHE